MSDSGEIQVFIPELETERLKLRGHEIDDFEPCVAMWRDPRVTRFIGGRTSSPQQTWQRFMGYPGHWAFKGFGYWAVEEKATGRYIGGLGFADFKRDTQPSIEGIPELGWALAPEAHGKGYATEALRAVVAWGDRHFGAIRTVCMIHPENAASIRVAEKIGFRRDGQILYEGQTSVLFARN